jgi:hypothetical protein
MSDFCDLRCEKSENEIWQFLVVAAAKSSSTV